MQERTVTIGNRLGLHARAAAQLVRRATQYTSRVELVRQDTAESADGKSILSVLVLAASPGTTLVIRTEGEDEQRAADALVELIQQRFGEDASDGVY
jgi:phosphotransferase system HPr (HPr) family protein